MRTDDLGKPMVPVSYALLVLGAAEAHGAPRRAVLAAAGLDPALVEDPHARMAALDIAALAQAAIELSGEPALGYEIGLSSSLTSHGIMGYGMLTSATLRDAILLGSEFLALRLPMLSAELREERDVAIVSVVETVPLREFRQLLLDVFMVKLSRIGPSLTDVPEAFDAMELWFDYPEPDYHRRVRHRLPTMRFEMGANEVRFPAALLDLRPETADPVNVKLIQDQCRRELAELGLHGDVVAQVRATLVTDGDGYPTLAEVAERLHTSSRTLKRRLHDQGTTFQQLLDAARRTEGIRLLTSTPLSVEQVARTLGYADASSFRRAFQGWTGCTPSEFRDARRVDAR